MGEMIASLSPNQRYPANIMVFLKLNTLHRSSDPYLIRWGKNEDGGRYILSFTPVPPDLSPSSYSE